jgi:hypothetical protein
MPAKMNKSDAIIRHRAKGVDDNGFFPNPFSGKHDFTYIRAGSAHIISYPGGTMTAPTIAKLRAQWNTRQGRCYTPAPRTSVNNFSPAAEIKKQGLAGPRVR